jgi:hypothetical protein
VPIVLGLTALAPSLIWALSSGAWLAAIVFASALLISQARQVSKAAGISLERRFVGFVASIGLAAFIFHATNLLVLRVAWPYIAGAVYVLIVSFSYFFRLLRTIIRTDADADAD